MKPEQIILEKKGPVACITINRPEAMNALNAGILARLGEIFDVLEEDNEVVSVVITGAGQKAFAAGADVREIKDAGPGRTAFITRGQETLCKIRNSSKVVIAAINGYALGGGCELALMCDLRVASENAKFSLPEAGLGVMAGYGATQLLPRLIGAGKAKYMMFTGIMLNAAEAYEIGLVEKIFPSEDLMKETLAIAEMIASKGPLAIRGTKKAIDGGLDLPLDDGLKFELKIYDHVANSEDAEGGLTSFLDKRKPEFRGK
jgi:enoyl-CoA hydratase